MSRADLRAPQPYRLLLQLLDDDLGKNEEIDREKATNVVFFLAAHSHSLSILGRNDTKRNSCTCHILLLRIHKKRLILFVFSCCVPGDRGFYLIVHLSY